MSDRQDTAPSLILAALRGILPHPLFNSPLGKGGHRGVDYRQNKTAQALCLACLFISYIVFIISAEAGLGKGGCLLLNLIIFNLGPQSVSVINA
ncbi:MAG: hypothetical protein COW90_03475 [Nitrospirae bacterium CG22_combo_CG10-13_8_21_14_all_44_11]|nr:MAG: hypothetical protein AUJ60_06225 [Nitrospirae bacterium CG1_02_44_142]PIP70767.1 MAG: hypothetical protein COW90_03475 [Nitrospirae bacterium CG22_combo_CG10-13_8_21_14_all_44_11]PIV40775.1 MAG: hypothetical protein COS28_07140 [Nitrospirae bacterium CG02_land_8_20_14_3_00_44_33]PIV66861.1 MAG: hypothetical protein COS10_04070 [Nitrospirae bacterium CG01_land_8_20_14_3_00_44_22]PJA83576.1 MAG: hypothetical protein CO147_01085 [Nitrospirae bacterium CG_4_9_14_3_um_filter_44_28]